jgi:hypothetical protein
MHVMAPLRLSASGTKCTTPGAFLPPRLLSSTLLMGMNEIFLSSCGISKEKEDIMSDMCSSEGKKQPT